MDLQHTFRIWCIRSWSMHYQGISKLVLKNNKQKLLMQTQTTDSKHIRSTDQHLRVHNIMTSWQMWTIDSTWCFTICWPNTYTTISSFKAMLETYNLYSILGMMWFAHMTTYSACSSQVSIIILLLQASLLCSKIIFLALLIIAAICNSA